ncbi:hypothetical protein BGZ83_004807 [Gryganskiella cystojenkinii]|nr:hypothetical protein BGZ83_004807 [Gryganskiella cystojenkinii]
MPMSQRPKGRQSVSNGHASSSGTSLSSNGIYPELKPLPQAHAPLSCRDPSQAIPFDMSILTIPHRKEVSSIKALIVGGGIAGLALAIMMDLAGIEYEILERTTGEEPPMGAAIALGPPVLRLMEQMGLLEDIKRVSKPFAGLTIVDAESKKLARVEGLEESKYGYPNLVLTRLAFIKILLARVPKENIHRGKTVVETHQNLNGVSCRCSDGMTYYGDIIVGADGSQSPTRDRLYLQLKEQGKLPDADMEPSVYEHVTFTGISDPLDPSLYPAAHEETSEFKVIHSKDVPYSFWYVPIVDDRVAWVLSCHTSTPKLQYHAYSDKHSGSSTSNQGEPATPMPTILHRSSSSNTKIANDWSVPAVDFEKTYKELLEGQCPLGQGTVRDFLKTTPRDRISGVDIQERLYKTWYSGRIVLVGDAAHQNLVVGGQGAIQCLLDGVCLVNLLYDMEYNTPDEISRAFKKYHARRSVVAKSSIGEASNVDKVFHGQGFMAGMMRKVLFNTVWSFNRTNDKFNCNRPQLSFLPFIEDRGASKPAKQKVSERLTRNRIMTP